MARMRTQTVHFKANGSSCPAYLSEPADDRTHPGLVVIQEWWGLDEHIKDVACRFAEQGYVALAPDLYRGQVTAEPDEAGKLAMNLNQDQAVKDIQGAIAYLKGQTTGKIGVIGYCMGGGLSLETACVSRDLSAAVVYYGSNPDPLDRVQSISCPLLGIYAEKDPVISPAQVEQLKQALDQHGKQYDIHIYPGTQHAFFNDMRPEIHDPQASRDAWSKTLTFLGRHLQ